MATYHWGFQLVRALRHPLNSKWVGVPESRLYTFRKDFWQLLRRQIPPNVTRRYKWTYHPSELNQCISGISITPELQLTHLFRFTLYLQNSKILISVLLAVRLYFPGKALLPPGQSMEKGEMLYGEFLYYLGTVCKTQTVYLNFTNVTIL